MDGVVLAGRVPSQSNLQKARPEETSAVHVLVEGTHRVRSWRKLRKDVVVDLVKRDVTSRFQVLIQPESLILAQSERWRQA